MVRSVVFIILLITGSGFAQTINSEPDSSRHKNAAVQDDWFGRDKLQHFIASAYLTGFGSGLSQQVFGCDEQAGGRYGAAFGITLGFGKELYDRFGRKQIFSWKDIAADALGVLVGLLMIGLWS